MAVDVDVVEFKGEVAFEVDVVGCADMELAATEVDEVAVPVDAPLAVEPLLLPFPLPLLAPFPRLIVPEPPGDEPLSLVPVPALPEVTPVLGWPALAPDELWLVLPSTPVAPLDAPGSPIVPAVWVDVPPSDWSEILGKAHAPVRTAHAARAALVAGETPRRRDFEGSIAQNLPVTVTPSSARATSLLGEKP